MSSGETPASVPRLRVTRVRRGRVLGGVCAGMPRIWGLGTAALRAIFILAGLCGGIGVIVYLACWLVLPVGDEDPEAQATPAVVWLAAGAGGLVALALVAGLSAGAAIFGFGWVVLGLAAVVLVLGLGPLARRVPLTVTLLGIAALTLPSVAVALTPLRLQPQGGAELARPADAAAIRQTTFSTGTGTELIDLRHTRLPTAGTVEMRIRAGLRRTIVALPADRCVRVDIHYDIHPFASHLVTLMSGSAQPPLQAVVLFGRVFATPGNATRGSVSAVAAVPGPTLDIDFSSQGGSLYVRDYPDAVSPTLDSYWPGFDGKPEVAPQFDGTRPSRKLVVLLDREWARRRAADIANERLIDGLTPGPCAR